METKTQQYQTLLYNLFQQHILTIQGQVSSIGNNPPEVFIPKSVVVDKMIELLNEFGEAISEEGKNEADKE